MEQVWKCGHCSKTGKEWYKMAKHEKNCQFNPETKHCCSCGNSVDEPFYVYVTAKSCKINLSVYAGKEDGNCEGWVKE